MNSWLLLVFLIHNVHPISIGLIRNVSLTLPTFLSPNIMDGTLEKCLCSMVISSNISALNYFSNNTCQLFSNTYLTDTYFSLTSNAESLFYFFHLPTNPTTVAQDLLTHTVSARSYIPSTEHTTTEKAKTSTAVAKTSVFTTAPASCMKGKPNIFQLSQTYKFLRFPRAYQSLLDIHVRITFYEKTMRRISLAQSRPLRSVILTSAC